LIKKLVMVESGHGDLFSEARIALCHSMDGSLALKFITAQPARGWQARRTTAFAAVTVAVYPVEFPGGNPIQQGKHRLNDQG
jgi:hypothetical protein